jgi:protein-S-isoprenylcysteine O-methyltransferase Ste14
MSGLELKIPPPVVGLACALAMKGIAVLATPSTAALPATGAGPGSWPALRVAAVALVVLGLAIDVAGVLSFRRARTTINPLKPANSSALVTSGVYRLTRNPMYLGMAVLLTAWSAWLGTPWALPGVVAFVAYITRFQILPEERVLAGRFGAEFATYRARVRRWI